jgi:hypothetical protein
MLGAADRRLVRAFGPARRVTDSSNSFETERLFVGARWYLKTPEIGVMDLTTFSSGDPDRLAWMSSYTPALADNDRWRSIKSPYRGLVQDGYPFYERKAGDWYLDGHEFRVNDLPTAMGNDLREEIAESARRFLEKVGRKP